MNAAAGAAAGRGGGIAVALAVVSVAVGLGAFSQYLPFFLAVGTALSLAYWVLGEGLGGIPSGTATDPNAGPLFVVLAAALFPWERRQSARATRHEWGTGQARTLLPARQALPGP